MRDSVTPYSTVARSRVATRPWFRPILILLLTSHAFAQPLQTPPSPPITDAQVRDAVAKLQSYLFDQQDPATGGWPEGIYGQGQQAGGLSATVVTALLASGVSAQHPAMRKAIAHLGTLDMTGVYARAMRAHVWARLSDAHHDKLRADAHWLTEAANENAMFGYGKPAGPFNHSTTHYGILGLWEAAKRGVHVKPEFWSLATAHFRRAQRGDGGWGYMPDSDSTGSMTAAGLTVMLIAQQETQRGQMKPDPRIAFPIAEGIAWFDKHFDGPENPFGQWRLYYLYAIERVALASGRRYFNEQDWFASGAQWIVDNLIGDGGLPGGITDSALGLMFLSRGRVPVWVSKIELPGQSWNNRPNDLYYLNEHLCEMSERELNWQTISIDQPADHWHDTPLAYLASGDAVTLTDAQIQNLRAYLDRGGTLLCNPDIGSWRFSRSIRALAEQLYPQWPMRELPDDHLMYSALHQISRRGSQKLYAVGNGARELIILADRDWAFQWQSSDARGKTAVWNIIANLWTIVTDRGLLRPRLDHRFDPPSDDEPTRTLTVGALRYAGNWRPEPLAWDTFQRVLLARTGMTIKTVPIDLHELDFASVDLLHIAGVSPHEFEADELRAMLTFARQGGTILVETVGGRGAFASDLERQMQDILTVAAAPISSAHPILSGEGLPHGIDTRHVRYRRYSSIHLAVGRRPRLAAVFLDDRPAILFSNEDLSLGLMRVRHWGISGYASSSAEALMTNLAQILHDSAEDSP